MESCGSIWGTRVHSRGSMTARRVVTLAIGAAVAVLVAACSLGADYPAVLDKPAPRAGEPMSPDQLKQATDALISDRDRLTAEAQAAGQPSAPATTATTGTTQTAGAAAKP